MGNKIEAIIFDWAGTTIDFGCIAPLLPFLTSFHSYGIDISAEEVRKPMGLLKVDHIRVLCQLDVVQQQIQKKYQRPLNEDDIQELYRRFEENVFAGLKNHATPMEGIVETIHKLRQLGMKIGSTTGYTRKMINIVSPIAAENGYIPDAIFCSDEVPRGRPYPHMIYKNCLELNISSSQNVIKVGDTLADIHEGLSAGCISVGVLKGSSEVGLSEKEYQNLSSDEMTRKFNIAKYRMVAAGAHYVIESMEELPDLLLAINALR